MELIPVLDLRAGQVVHARRGERGRYAPIESALCPGADPLALAQALVDLTGTRTLYLADLDGVLDGRPQAALLRRLVQAWPQLRWWIDAGWQRREDAWRLRDALGSAGDAVVPVYGTESLADRAALEALQDDPRAVLSLDRRASRPMDPAGLWDCPQLWLPTTIVMTLERVGSGAGPDLQTLPALRRQAPQVTCWVGSGGVRHPADLAAGAAAGADAWLVASALHTGGWPAGRVSGKEQATGTAGRHS
ncbi:HisA/HisF-related TIM barrel protein [Ideonella alba]|uniref:Nickel transporter n=1 Tax=Ideonella alba TaxID=2824118 RepID=A0A940YIU1_9BURK|nr:HisA/HisF-related TIM barrel protein [Ideonella alba]MBQ0930674.1 nickel transporter [Ideonella alba]